MRKMIVVNGQPQGKARARTVTQGGKTHSYTPPKTAAYEALIAGEYRSAFPGAEPATGPVQVKITAYFLVPKSWPRRRKQEALAGLIAPTVVPDCDNILKVAADALNGIAWADDKQITYAEVQKHYAVTPRMEIEIWES